MENLMPFKFEEINVRTLVEEDGSVWFVAKDVAEVLKYKTWHTNLIGNIPDEWKGSKRITTLGGSQEVAMVSEQGLYFFLARSDMPKALPFQKWITGEVVPSIRKTGSYSIPKADKYAIMRNMLNALEAQEKKIEKHESEIKGLQMDLYKRDGYFCVAGYLSRLGQPCDTKTAAKHGRKLSSVCRARNVEISSIDHPAFGRVNTYPEAMLDEYFGMVKVPVDSIISSPDRFCDHSGFN